VTTASGEPTIEVAAQLAAANARIAELEDVTATEARVRIRLMNDLTAAESKLARTEAEQAVLDAMGRIDEMQLQMTAENDEGDDPWVMPALREIARRRSRL